MACLIYLISKTGMDTNFSNDLQVFCLLLAIEWPQWTRIIIYLWSKR